MKSNVIKYCITILTIIFLSVIFILFTLNILTVEFLDKSIYNITANIFTTEKIFSQNNLGHQIGKKDGTINYGREIIYIAKPFDYKENENNYLTFGPEIFLLPGKYTLTFNLAGVDLPSDEKILRLDVFRIKQGTLFERQINSDELNSDFRKFNIDFETDGGQYFEFRIYYFGQGEIKAGDIELKTIDRNYSVFLKRFFIVLKDKI